jgi:hypothetical protein
MATLTITFSSDNNPTNGYIVKYRQVGTTQYTKIEQNPTGSPIIITGLGSGVTYEGTIQGDCGNGQYGATSTFTATVAARFNMSRDPSSATNACGLTNYNYTFYAAVPVLVVSTQLYANADLSTAYTTGGYFSNGTNVYQISSLGTVLSVATCTINP